MTVLAISSLLDHQESQSDEEQFEFASDMLQQLRSVGNYAAGEFYQHLEAMKKLMPTAKNLCRNSQDLTSSTFESMDYPTIDLNDNQGTTASARHVAGENSLSDPLLLQFLEQPLPDLEFIDASMFMDELQTF